MKSEVRVMNPYSYVWMLVNFDVKFHFLLHYNLMEHYYISKNTLVDGYLDVVECFKLNTIGSCKFQILDCIRDQISG